MIDVDARREQQKDLGIRLLGFFDHACDEAVVLGVEPRVELPALRRLLLRFHSVDTTVAQEQVLAVTTPLVGAEIFPADLAPTRVELFEGDEVTAPFARGRRHRDRLQLGQAERHPREVGLLLVLP